MSYSCLLFVCFGDALMVKRITVRLSDQEAAALLTKGVNMSDAVRSCLNSNNTPGYADELIMELRGSINKLESKNELLERRVTFLLQPWPIRLVRPFKPNTKNI